jgi:iron(III)-enterobactin esterase
MNPEAFILGSTSKKFSRKIWYLPSETKCRRIGIFLDGESYLDQMDAGSLIVELQRENLIPPMACLFVSSVDAESRHHDYTCSDPYADYIAKDVLPWVQRRAGIAAPGDHFIGGLSLSGLQAAYISLSYPHIFSRTLSQSGSFWWENEWLTHHLNEFPPSEGKYWLSVGTKEKGAGACHAPTDLLQEIDQDVAIRHFSTALKRREAKVHDHVYEGGHDPRHWSEELPDALRWLLGKSS